MLLSYELLTPYWPDCHGSGRTRIRIPHVQEEHGCTGLPTHDPQQRWRVNPHVEVRGVDHVPLGDTFLVLLLYSIIIGWQLLWSAGAL